MTSRPALRARGTAVGARSLTLGTRLLAAQILVVLSGALTAWLVASAVAPALFHRHMHQAAEASDAVTTHAEQAFRSANAISLAMALLAALVTSVAASVYLARRMNRVVAPLAAAADRVARGDYEARVALPGLGPEFDGLTTGFNQMAGQLAQIETTRRRMLGDLAHELRTPVAVLDGYLEAFEDGVSVPDAATIGLLREQTARIALLAEDVSALSRAEEHQLPLRLQRVDVDTVVATAAAAARNRYQSKGVALGEDVPEGIPPVAVDVDRMGQVLGNLLDNALRHTPAGGVVRVRAGVEDSVVMIEVADSGEGIGAEHLPHLFERFYRADQARDRARGGSGIGLAIVKAIVEEHGGSVAVDSAGPGQGACFTLLLPAAPAPPS